MGLGLSGRAAIRYLHAKGMRVALSDVRDKNELLQDERAFLQQHHVETEFGGHTEEFLSRGCFVFLSPGISPDSELLMAIRSRGIPVIGELALAAAEIDVPVVGITGTNGKTTVTSLIGELLAQAGKKVFVGGNIGTPLLDYLRKPYGAEVLVLELSSFQLEMAGDFRCDVALLLNVTPDHLDRHGTIERYGAIKMKIFDNQKQDDTSIISSDDPMCNQLRSCCEKTDFLLFGYSNDCHAMIIGNRVQVNDRRGNETFDLISTPMANHIGLLNSSAAILAARAFGCGKEQIMKGLADFSIGPHRMEWVDRIEGVDYYNDSKATNSGAVISALHQLEGPVILIAGGRDKGDDYSLLLPAIKGKVSRVIVIGEAKEQIIGALEGAVDLQDADSMDEAVELARQSASPGDTVLLSPACASFDMFNSYGQRGDTFKQLVRSLAEAH